MEKYIPQVLKEMHFVLLEFLVHLLVLFLQGTAQAGLTMQFSLPTVGDTYWCSLVTTYRTYQKKSGCLESTSLVLKRTTLRFLKNSGKQKERDKHRHTSIRRETHAEHL